MIRINLLAVERERKKVKGTFQVAQKLTIGCSLILVLAVLFMGWRYWSLGAQSKQLDDEIVAHLEGSGFFKKSIDIVNSSTEALPTPPGELIKFSIKAVFQQPGELPASSTPKKGG